MHSVQCPKSRRTISGSKERKKNNTLCVIDGHLSSQEFGVVSLSFQNTLLQRDIVKDDSGSYVVFPKQSSASQITAAKVMVCQALLPTCAGQAADAVSALHPVQNGRCTKVRMSRNLDMSTKTQVAQIMVQFGRLRCSS